jgi:hypothetical protein
MKKILTIAATAGLLSALAGSAQAQVVNFPGTVPPSCNVTASTNGALTPNVAIPTSLIASTYGKVTVICNTETSVLTLTQGASVIEAQTPAPTVTFGFAPTGSTGIYSAVVSGTVSPASGSTTAAIGDIASIDSTIAAAPGKLLKAGSYTVVVNATIAP